MRIDLFDWAEDHSGRPDRLYIVGDIHGCADALTDILRQIGRDLIANPVERPFYASLVFVGDYIDRGPKNFETVELMARLQVDPQSVFRDLFKDELEWPTIHIYDGYTQIECFTLSGNHEDMFMKAIDLTYDESSLNGRRFSDSGPIGNWISNGGYQVITQYMKALGTKDFMLPVHHQRFFRNLKTAHVLLGCGPESDETWVIVHAGIHPTTPLDNQLEESVKWIRDVYYTFDFTSRDMGPQGKIRVIGGHTPVKQVVCKGGKIMLDTGCVFGNKLSCVVMETNKPFEPLRILEATQEGVEDKF